MGFVQGKVCRVYSLARRLIYCLIISPGNLTCANTYIKNIVPFASIKGPIIFIKDI